MPARKNILGHAISRAVMVYGFVVLAGSLLSSIFIAIEFGEHEMFIPIFLVEALFVGITSLPNLMVLMLGLYGIYKKVGRDGPRWLYLILLSVLVCLLPFVIYLVIMFEEVNGSNREFWSLLESFLPSSFGDTKIAFLAVIPYVACVFLGVLGGYYYDRNRFLLEYHPEKEVADDSILDDGLF